MKHNSLRVSRMVQELLNYSFTLGAKDINIDINEGEKEYKIIFRCNIKHCPQEKIIQMERLLKCGKNEEMEEYYWALAGESDTDTELSLVGMMSDRVEINIVPDKILEIILWRYK